MNIAVVGLGLIGGSFCKAISAKTEHSCFGIDTDKKTIACALEDRAIVRSIDTNELCNMDMVIVCLFPQQTIDFILDNADNFKKGSIVIDSCGIKTSVCNAVSDTLREKDVCFIGCHPMAGREFSGYGYSLENLFTNASFITTPYNNTPEEKLRMLKDFALSIGFSRVVVSTPEDHDSVIAFTSQLAHVVSNAYIKSPTLAMREGFSAGSFEDLTRVAKLNENMWSQLFVLNKEPLLFEIDTIINHLKQYRDAISSDNEAVLKELLREGRILKENSIK